MKVVLSSLRSFEGIHELAPVPGSEHPEVSWGDFFFYYAPDGKTPNNRQPFATIITKDYPGDEDSKLNELDRWRLNIHVGSALFKSTLGYSPEDIDPTGIDYSTPGVFFPHPQYGGYGWVSIVNPDLQAREQVNALLREAHQADKSRVERRDQLRL